MNNRAGGTAAMAAGGKSGLSTAIWGFLAGLCIAQPALASPFDATPANNNAIAAVQGSLMGAHIGGLVGGIAAPGWFGTGFEVAAMAADIGLKNTPPVFEVPGGYSRFPNSPRLGDIGGPNCVYKFGSTIRSGSDILMDGYTGGVQESFASLFFVPFDPLDRSFADLGHPYVYHVQADVRVRASNPFLGAGAYRDYGSADQRRLQQRPEFPAGRHTIGWSATTSMNAIFDIAVPAALVGVGAAAEGYLSKKAAAAVAKRAAREAAGEVVEGVSRPMAEYASKGVLLAADLGLIASDVSGLAQAAQWYQDTSFDTASNRASQTLTIWDNTVPYLRDVETGANYIETQDIEVEAMDFGGVRFGRVEKDLLSRFQVIDPCGEAFEFASDSPSSRLFPIGGPEDLNWEIRERDGGPYHSSATLRGNQEREGDSLVTRLLQRVSVVDTQAPILIPPAGFARYDEDGIDLTAEDFPLGRPRVVDLADPSPTVTNDAPEFLAGPPDGEDGVRYEVTWDALDGSGNSARQTADDPSTFVQTITLKRPGTNNAPEAVPNAGSGITADPVEIWLEGIDTDLIGGRVDPLEFHIDDFPANGQFDAPLYPYFIEDFRLTPVGEREEGDNLTRVSPLKHLADEFRLLDPNDHGAFLTDRICDAEPGSLEDQEFAGVIPVDMVYEPSYVHVDDDGFYYIRDKYYVCGESQNNTLDLRPVLSPIPRLSKWTETGELIATTPLAFTDDPNDSHDHITDNSWPNDRFSVDHNDRLWVSWRPIISTFGTSAAHYSYDKNFGDVRYHGTVSYDETDTILGEGLRDIGSDSNSNLLFELIRGGINVRSQENIVDLGNSAPPIGALDVSLIDIAQGGYFGEPGSQIGDDLAVDRDGNVYVLDRLRNRIHKWEPTTADGQGGWNFGDYVGWMGSCTANKTIDGTPTGVPYNACDVDTGTSRGYACADAKCERAADTAGSGPGQFDTPASFEVDPRNILYVADTANQRVQRFGQDGTFAGEAKSTGSGVNQGDEPGFILGNMGEPQYLSVNSTSFFVMEPNPDYGDYFVHVFKTLPFREVTDSRAKVIYVSDFNFQGDDFFTYYVDDGIDESERVTVDLSITRAFRPPENLRTQCFATAALETEIPCELAEDTSIYVRLSATDPDGFISDFPDGLDTHTFEILDDVQNGTRVLDDPALERDNSITFLYTPDPDFHGDDGLRFRVYDGAVYSETDADALLTVTPVPDPVVVEFDDELRAARGFPTIFKADFDDVDDEPDQQASLLELDWGDATAARPGTGWLNSGHEDLNGREISPQIDFGRGAGMLLGSHDYDATGSYRVSATMSHAPVEGLNPVTYSANLDVLDVTVVGAGLSQPADDIAPDVPFPLVLTVENLEPSSWAGFVAEDVSIAFDVPEGLSVAVTDPRCSGTDRISCTLGDLAQGEATDVTLGGLVPLAAARDQATFELIVDIVDAGPKLTDDNSVGLALEVADGDDDGTIDVDDAFVDDPRYQSDTDGDGLADSWEEAFGFDPEVADDVTADTDGDGYTLLDEFRNGSFPNRADRRTAIPADRLESPDNTAEDAFGLAMAGGDLNDDGFDDLVIGASRYEADGAVFIAWGTLNGASPALDRLRPAAAGSAYGRSVAVGDWDDNGYPDVAIADQALVYLHWNNGEILETPDRALVVNNSTTPSRISLFSDDLDGDGLAELIVNSYDGSITLIQVYGSASGGLDAAPQTFALGSRDHYGQAIGDVDGDGAPDLLLGNSADDIVNGFLAADNDWSAGSVLVDSFSVLAPTGQSRFGWGLASGEDVTGDGIDDLVVGAYTGGGFVNLYASEDAYFTNNGAAPLQTIAGASVSEPNNGTHGDQLGVSLALAQLDTDGFADLVVGGNRAGPADEGQVRILRGSPAGFVDEQLENGTTTYDLLGHNVVVPGDLDGNGVADIAGGATDIFTAQNPQPNGGYVQLWYHGYDPLIAGDDDDDDGVGLAVDNCPADVNTNQSDIDADSVGDACDDDIDGDGLANAVDNCPVDNSLDQTDTDGDLDGDICDRDDDNDAVADADDAFPLDERWNADADDDGMADAWETDFGLDPADAADAMADLDGDGRPNLAEFEQGFDVTADDVAPEMSPPASLVVDSIGPWTPVALDPPAAVDFKDGDLAPVANGASPFRPGRHVLTWTASDAAGNATAVEQTVDVIPQVGFVGDTLLAAEGESIELLVALNGAAVSYPVTVPYTLGGTAAGSDHTLAAGEIVIDNSGIAALGFDTVADGDAEDEETLTLTLGTPSNAIAGSATAFDLRIADGNRAPAPRLAIEQDGRRVTTVTRDGAAVVVSVDPADANTSDNHSYDWRASDSALAPQEGFEQATFTLDPSTLDVGTYRVEVAVTDDGNPQETASASRYLRVLATAPTFTPGTDSDGDGIADVDEGLRDSNDNGVSDYLDPDFVSHHLPARNGGGILQANAGYTLALGRVALATGEDAIVSMMDVADFGDAGGPAADGEDSRFSYPSGLFDFEVGGLPADGHVIRVVIPQTMPLAADMTWRKFVAGQGWKYFVADANNAVASAAGEPGVCPAPGSGDYTAGLAAGHHCVQLTLEDGGPNDADGEANRVVRDPGGAAALAQPAAVGAGELSVANKTVTAGQADVVMLRFRLQSNSSDVVLEDLTLDASGSGNDAADIGRVALWVDVDGDGAIGAGDTEIGSGSYPANDGTLTLTMTTPYTLDAGTTDFIVSYDF